MKQNVMYGFRFIQVYLLIPLYGVPKRSEVSPLLKGGFTPEDPRHLR